VRKFDFDKVMDVSSKDICKLIEKWRGDYVLKNIEKCKWLDDTVAKSMIDHWFGNFVARNVWSFDDAFHASIAQMLVNQQYSFFDYAENFKLNNLFLCFLVDLSSHLWLSTVARNEKLEGLWVDKEYLDDLAARRKYLAHSIILLKKLWAREAWLSHLKKTSFSNF